VHQEKLICDHCHILYQDTNDRYGGTTRSQNQGEIRYKTRVVLLMQL